ncbi:hypothetical protein DXG01_015495 [Tephrocybe rancida]|nr:hypothetical protein DXG01_015495 [Tephrocybe rancida]
MVGIFTVYAIIRGSLDDPKSFLGSWAAARRASVGPSGSPAERQGDEGSDGGSSTFEKALFWFRRAFRRPCVFYSRSDVETATGTEQQNSKWARVSQSEPPRVARLPDSHEGTGQLKLLALDNHTAFHSVICNTHDDDVLHRAITALPSLILDRKQAASAITGYDLHAIPDEVRTFQHLLSLDVSIRCNLAAASNISASLLYDRFNDLSTLQYQPDSIIDLISALCLSARRSTDSQYHMTNTILHLLSSIMNPKARETHRYSPSDILPTKSPIFGLLFMPFIELQLSEAASQREHLRLLVVNHAYHCLNSISDIGHVEDAPDLLEVLRALETDISTVLPSLVRSWNVHSSVPFLLTLIPVGLGTGLAYELGPNYLCFVAFVKLIFAPDVSQLSLNSMVEAIRKVIEYHKDNFCGTPESLDLFVATHTFLHALGSSIYLKLFHVPGSDLGWSFLFRTCVMLVQFVFDPLHHPTVVQVSPPRLLHGVIINILKHLQRVICELPPQALRNFHMPNETQHFLRSIETGDASPYRYLEEEKADLLNVLHSIDPSFAYD